MTGSRRGPSQQLDDMGLEHGRSAEFHRYHGLRGDRDGPRARAGLARRTRCYPPSATSSAGASSTRSSPQRRRGRRHAAAGPRGGRTRSSSAASCAAPRVQPTGRLDRHRDPRRVHRRRRRRQQPLRPSARHVPASATGRTARRSARTGPRRGTTSRGSSRRSTSRTATATRCPATAGSSRSATAPSTSASACCRRPATSRASTPPTCSTRYAHQIADRWEIDPADPERPAERPDPDGWVGRPKAGPTYLVVGDAAGSVNPFNGDGIDYALRDRRRSPPTCSHEALSTATPTALQRYPKLLEDEYGQYFKVARLFARVIGRPALMRELTRAGMHSRTLMEWVAADHGEPPAPRRARPGRGRVQGSLRDRQPRAERLAQSAMSLGAAGRTAARAQRSARR